MPPAPLPEPLLQVAELSGALEGSSRALKASQVRMDGITATMEALQVRRGETTQPQPRGPMAMHAAVHCIAARACIMLQREVQCSAAAAAVGTAIHPPHPTPQTKPAATVN